MVSAPMSSSSSSTQSQQQQQQDCPDQQQDQQQLYYAQLLAAQQQAIISSSASSTSSNSSEKNGGETGNNSINEEMAKSEAAKKESDREKKEREWSERNTNLIVNYVPQNMTQEEVRALFGSMGEVESCKLIRDKATGQSLGYAFVNYERPEDAQKALISMNGLRIQNKTLKVSLARPSKDDIKGANLYVSGLPKSLTQPELEAAFRVYGSIITSRILYDNVTGLSKGVGFVRFDRKLEAEQAIDKMTGTSPWGGDEPVTVKFANSPSTNSAKSTAIQMAQSLLPLHQMLQPNGCAASAASVTAVNAAHPSLLPSLIPSLSAAHQPHPSSSMANVAAAAGGPIHAHTPQHRFRYSPLAGAPLISTSAPMVSSAQTAGGAMALSAAGVNPLLASAVNPTALVTSMAHQQQQQQQQDYLALLQQQLLQQQLAAYAAAMATNPQQQQHQAMSSLSQMVAAQQQQQQQQYSAYAAALSAAGMASTTAAGQSAVAAVGTLNGFHHHQQSKSPSTNSSAAASGWTLSICNLAPETEESLLWKLFGPFGAVLSVQVLKGKGIGLVTMANYEEAYAAISGLNGQQLGGRTLQVAYSSNQAAAGAVTAAGLPSLLRS